MFYTHNIYTRNVAITNNLHYTKIKIDIKILKYPEINYGFKEATVLVSFNCQWIASD